MKIFSKDKYIREQGMAAYRTSCQCGNWIDECDGKTVINGYCGDYHISDRWCIDVQEDVNCKCAVKSTPTRYKIIIECDGTTTTSRIEINGKQVKTAQAKRNPADKFDWRIGAETAFGRLFAKKEEKKKRPFMVGDRVVCIFVVDGNESVVGKHGKIVRKCANAAWYGVDFDEKLERGHECSGSARPRHGWNCPANALRHE